MTDKIKRIFSILLLVAAIFSAVLLPASGYCENLRFVFLADSRSNSPPSDYNHLNEAINKSVLDAMINKIKTLSPKPSFAVCAGDFAYRGCFYFGGATPYYTFQTWQDVMNPLKDDGVTIYPVIGNHELYDDIDGTDKFKLDNQTAYQNQFKNIPNLGSGPPGYEALTYYFESPGGDAFFAVLDPYYLTQDVPNPDTAGEINDTQLNWLTDRLKNTKATHKILFIHPPYYYVEKQSPENTSRRNLWKLCDDNKVAIYCCGHTHLFSRKTIDSTIAPIPAPTPPFQWKNNVVQLITGTCGAPPSTGSLVVDRTLWHVYNDADTYYFSVVDINGSKVTVTSYSYNQTTKDFSIIDVFSNQYDLSGVNLLLTD